MKRVPIIKVLFHFWTMIGCILRVWDYNKFRKSLLFNIRFIRNRSADLKFRLKGTDHPLIFHLQITGDVLVFIPNEDGWLQPGTDAAALPSAVNRQLKALMYAPHILAALFTEITGIVILVFRYRNELHGLFQEVIKLVQ